MTPTAPGPSQRSASTGQVTGSDLVVAAVRAAGGTANRREVLDVLTEQRGRRDAGLATSMAVMLGRVENTVLPDGHAGLELAEGER